MPQETLTQRKNNKPALNSYSALVRSIRKTIDAGKVRATQAVENELKRTKWEAGKLILEHILLNKDRADYGEQVLKRLSKDLSTSQTELSYMLEFARSYPIFPAPGKLSWAHYRELLSVNDSKERSAISSEAKQNKWSQKQLRKEIKKLKTSKQITVTPEPKLAKLPGIKPGQPGLFSIFELGGKTYRDLGFSTWQEVKGLKITNTKEAELYTYEAQVTKVFDGDTFHVIIYLRENLYLEQRVRLRRLDAPEVMTVDGQQAKKVLERILSSSVKRGRTKEGAQPILIKVSKTDDQYGRYLVDTWVPPLSSKDASFGSLSLRAKRSNLDEYINIDQELLNSGVFEVRGDYRTSFPLKQKIIKKQP